MTEAIIIALIANTAMVIATLIKQGSIAKDAKEARDQTANTHSTNLRDDVDRVIAGVSALTVSVEDLRCAQEQQAAETRRITSKLEFQHRDDEFLGETIDRTRIEQERALAMAVQDRRDQFDMFRREIPDIIRAEIGNHVSDCPLRNPKGTQ
jgi:hypothetical protein